jgi:hypothetical protein
MSPTEFKDLDHYVETTMLQAFKSVTGVVSARAFHSLHGQIVFVVDLKQTGSLDAVFESPEMGKACLGLSKWLVRTNGAEVMWEVGRRGVNIVFEALTAN